MIKDRRRSNISSRVNTRQIYTTNAGAASSRRVNSEKKKIVHQTFLLIIFSFIILIAFIFVIIPGFIRLTGDFFDSSTPFQQKDEIAPQIPIISAPPAATSSAQLKVNGFGEPESDLILVLNGRKEGAIKINGDGSFEVGLTLDEGENNISAYCIDKSENESDTTREYMTLLDTEAPKLEVAEPKDGSSFESRAQQSIKIKGTTDKGAKIYVNKRAVFPDEEGNFEHSFMLAEGENKIEVMAEDKAKNSTIVNLTYNFKF